MKLRKMTKPSVAETIDIDRMRSVLPRKRKGRKGKLMLLGMLPLLGLAAYVVYSRTSGSRRVHSSYPHPGDVPAHRREQDGGSGGASTRNGGTSASPAVIEGREHEDVSPASLMGKPVMDIDGAELGRVEAVYRRGEEFRPEWVALTTRAINPRRVLVPIVEATIEHDVITVPYRQEQVREAPAIDADTLGEGEEHELYLYYNLRRVTEGDEATLATSMPPLRA